MNRRKAGQKALRVSARRGARNVATKHHVRDAVRAVRKAVAAGQADQARSALVKATSQIDRAVKANVLHRNKGARLVSRLARSVGSKA